MYAASWVNVSDKYKFLYNIEKLCKKSWYFLKLGGHIKMKCFVKTPLCEQSNILKLQ